MAAHPTWDGRGVTVGILDTGITLDHPSLLTTSTGERKIVDWVTATAETGDDDPTWLDMQTQVNGPTFTFGSVTLHRAGGRDVPLRPCSTSATRASAARSATTSTATATRPAPAGSSACSGTDLEQRLGRRQPEPQLRRRAGDDRLQGPLRRRLLRHRQPGDRRRRADAVRRADRRQDQVRQHRHRLRRSTARTWPASSPATACSAGR